MQTVRVSALNNRVPSAVLLIEIIGAAVGLGLLALYLAILSRGVITVVLAAAFVSVLLLTTFDLTFDARVRNCPRQAPGRTTGLDGASPGGPDAKVPFVTLTRGILANSLMPFSFKRGREGAGARPRWGSACRYWATNAVAVRGRGWAPASFVGDPTLPLISMQRPCPLHGSRSRREKPRVCRAYGEVGGTGLEPVTPSLSTRSSVRVSSLRFAQGAWLSGISRRANLTERERTSSVAIVATRIQTSGDSRLARATSIFSGCRFHAEAGAG